MRLSQCLFTAAYLCTGVTAFVPYSFKIKTPVADSSDDNLVRRFLPWKMLSGGKPQDEVEASRPRLTLDARGIRRDNIYQVVLADKPTSPDTVALHQEGYDFSYFATVNVGTPGQPVWMMLDTGGANTWVFSSDCTSEACKMHNTFGEDSSSTVNMTSDTFSVGYGTGNVRGVLVTDHIAIAHINVEMTFGLVERASDDFRDYPMDGILGLGRSNDSSLGRPSFMDVVAKEKDLQSNIVGFHLSRSSDGAKDGAATFGAVDKTKFTGDITYTDVDNSSIHWCIPLQDASVDGKPCGFTDKLAIIDTGTSYALIPPKDAEALHALIPGSRRYSEENFLIPCDSTAVVQVTFSGVSYTISPKDYVGSSVEDGCFSTFVSSQLFGENDWILGDTFLKNVYSVFDFDNDRIGFAKLPPPPPVETTTPSAPAPTDTFASGTSTESTDSSSPTDPAQFTGAGIAAFSITRHYWPALAVVLCVFYL